MTELTGWKKIAREIGDHTCIVYCHGESVDECRAEMERMPPSMEDKYVGDWLPAEAAAKEILRLRERVKVLDGGNVPLSVMEFSVVRVATAGKWFAKGWVNGQIVRGPDASSMGDAVVAFCAALTAAEQQQETTDGN